MKKNRRQELQTNILADRLGGVIQRVRPYLKVAGVTVGLGLLIIVVVSWQRASARKKATALWEEFMKISVEAKLAEISDADALGRATRLSREITAYSSVAADLEALADSNKGAEAEGWIRAAAGNALLAVGMRQLYTDQAEARLTFLRTRSIYEDLLAAGHNDNGELYDRIRYGYGQASEGLSFVPSKAEAKDKPSQTDLHQKYIQDAQETYRQLADTSTSTGVKRLAEYRLRILSPIAGKTWADGKILAERQDWASWLAQQDLPEPPPSADGGLGGAPPFNPGALPAGLSTPPPAPVEGAAETTEPAKDPVTPTENDPEANDPGDKKPAEDGTNAEPKKGGAKPAEPPADKK